MAIKFPTIEYGYRTTPIRMGGVFPGALDIRASVLRDQLFDILVAAHRDGARNFVVLHASYANVPVCADAITAFAESNPAVQILAGSWWDFASEETRNAIAEQTGVSRGDDNHAALVETSLVMHIAPEAVRADLIVDDICERRIRHLVLPVPQRVCTKAGIVYRATGSSAELGAFLLKEIARNLLNAISEDLPGATTLPD